LQPRPNPAEPAVGLRERLLGLSAESTPWIVGLFCGLLGAFVLVAPHQLSAPAYASIRPYAPWWGAAALAAGVMLLGVAVVRPRRWVEVATHALAAMVLLALAVSFARIGGWLGVFSYGALGAGIVRACCARRAPRPAPPAGGGGDLFAFLMGVVATLDGVALLVAPGLLAGQPRAWRPGFGLAFLLCGPLLCLSQLRPRRRALPWLVQLLAGALFVVFGAVFAYPTRGWTGVAFFCGCGGALALLPWLRRRLAALDAAALRTRLALALATATSVSLIIAVAVVTAQEERLATVQILATRRIEAQAIAQDVAAYVQLNAAWARAMAATAGRAPWTPTAQRELLLRSRRSYPDVAAFLSVAPDGTPVADTGGVPLAPEILRDAAVWARRRPEEVELRLIGSRRPLLVVNAPIREGDGRPGGVLVAVVDSAALGRRIATPESNVYLADGFGQAIASRVAVPAAPEPMPGWDRRFREGGDPAAALRLGALARVPGLGWVVAVERPRSIELAGVRQGRELAFALLLLLVPLAVMGGVVAARRIAHPLDTLADAVDQLAAGNTAAPLGSSTVSEVARLSAAFAQMRDRLAERTAESARLAAELRARAEALADSDRRKDEFLAMLAHELRNPLGAIASAAYLLDQLGPAPPMERPVAIIRRQIQHLVRLVDDLLDVSRITRGKVMLQRQPVDLAEVVRRALETTQPVLEERQHQLRLSLPATELPLDADSTRLEQVLGNLVRNAAKFTPPGGQIEVAAWSEGSAAMLAVRDDGAGIAPELLPRVFDLFTQGEQTLDRAGGGLGIGLTLVRQLVEMHGGRVEAHSDGPGRGSEFLVRLPLRPAGREEVPREGASDGLRG
jgi:signal transduction histidine kinase